MTTDLTERVDISPGLRVAWHGYMEEFGRPPARVWQVPGTVTLLASGPLRLTVATPWGTIAAAESREDDIIEVAKSERPGQRHRLTVAEAAAGAGPDWTGTALRSVRGGATLLVKSDVPDGCGVGSVAATEMAIRLCLSGARDAGPGTDFALGWALAGSRLVPFDLASAGLRLVVIDTRVRSASRPAPAESSAVEEAAAALAAGDIEAVGPLLTAAHQALDCDDAQRVAVEAALRAGALGARMITDGPGRACALVPLDRLPDVRAAVREEFVRAGLVPPRFLTFSPAAGTERIWPAG